MSGHSHFATIKHKKGANDAKRSALFSKIAKELTIAARENNDPDANPRLRITIEKARKLNMPSDNIERAIKRGSGEDGGNTLEEILFEMYGPGGVALLADAITDNKNRSVGEVRQILTKFQGKLVEGGAVRWMFDRKGCIILPIPQDVNKEELELSLIEDGAEDIVWQDEAIEVYALPTSLEQTRKNIEKRGLPIESVSLVWAPKELADASPEDRSRTEALYEALDEHDSIQDVFSNLRDR